jgi:hypothetical protein
MKKTPFNQKEKKERNPFSGLPITSFVYFKKKTRKTRLAKQMVCSISHAYSSITLVAKNKVAYFKKAYFD